MYRASMANRKCARRSLSKKLPPFVAKGPPPPPLLCCQKGETRAASAQRRQKLCYGLSNMPWKIGQVEHVLLPGKQAIFFYGDVKMDQSPWGLSRVNCLCCSQSARRKKNMDDESTKISNGCSLVFVVPAEICGNPMSLLERIGNGYCDPSKCPLLHFLNEPCPALPFPAHRFPARLVFLSFGVYALVLSSSITTSRLAYY